MMTDKQMIVDCEHDMNYCEDNNCKHYGNKEQCEKTHCYYRCYSKLYTALKRKEQECEELKKQVEIFTRQLEKANKEVIKEKEKNATQRQKNEKYKQTLAYIKEIAEKEFKYFPDGNIFVRPEIKQILQKISEVENE